MPFCEAGHHEDKKEAERIEREWEQQASRKGQVELDPETRLGHAQAMLDVLGDFEAHLTSHNLGHDTVKQYLHYLR